MKNKIGVFLMLSLLLIGLTIPTLASPVINAKEVTSIGMVEKVGTFNKIQSQLVSDIAESFEDATEEIGSSPNHVTLYVANGITVEVIYRHGIFAGEVEIDTNVAPESAWSHDGNKMWGRYSSPFWAGVYMNGDNPKTLFAGTYKIFKFKFIDRYYGRWMVQGWDGQTLNGWAIFR
ncbi:MAG: hypothetical protein Q8P20_08065 [bacterium]|nr:hypothetical protein [bacterium]